MKDDPLYYHLMLSRAGYGSLLEVEQWDARKVLQALNYEKFRNDYEAAHFKSLREP